jgi:hypothetical protein
VLTLPAKTGPWWSAQNFLSRPALDDWFAAAHLNFALARPGQEATLTIGGFPAPRWEVELWADRGGQLKIIAAIVESAVIERSHKATALA